MYSIFGLLSALLIGVILIILLLHKSEDDAGYVNDIPVIGIITIPEYGQNTVNLLILIILQASSIKCSNKYPQSSNTTFILTQYVKYVGSVGAVAIPIHYNEKPQRIEYLMEHINGALFTGGALDFINEDTGELLPYSKTVNTVFEKAKKLKDNGVHFPIKSFNIY